MAKRAAKACKPFAESENVCLKNFRASDGSIHKVVSKIDLEKPSYFKTKSMTLNGLPKRGKAR